MILGCWRRSRSRPAESPRTLDANYAIVNSRLLVRGSSVNGSLSCGSTRAYQGDHRRHPLLSAASCARTHRHRQPFKEWLRHGLDITFHTSCGYSMGHAEL